MVIHDGSNMRNRSGMTRTETVSERTSGQVEDIKKVQESLLTCLWNDLPPWQQDNHYIHSGYRPATNSYKRSADSIWHLHNESVNIWTHLVGALLALTVGTYMYHSLKPRYNTASDSDIAVLSCYFAGATCCLGMSAAYHTICNHSHEVAKVGNKLDYLGIVLLIWGSFVPSIYYGFHLQPSLVRIYWVMITIIGLGCIIVSVNSKFRTPTWRPFRASMFVAMGLSAVVPVLHGLNLYGREQLERQMGLSYVVSQGVLYIAGAGLYAGRIPERFAPGRFDIWGSSHQIFHVLVLLAAGTHLVGLLKAFDYAHRNGIVATVDTVLSWT